MTGTPARKRPARRAAKPAPTRAPEDFPGARKINAVLEAAEANGWKATLKIDDTFAALGLSKRFEIIAMTFKDGKINELPRYEETSTGRKVTLRNASAARLHISGVRPLGELKRSK